MKNLFIIGLLLCNYLLHTQTLSPLQKTRIDSAQKVMEKLFKGNWKKGSIPELWDGKSAERIIQIIVNL